MAWNHGIIKTFLPTTLITCKLQFKKKKLEALKKSILLLQDTLRMVSGDWSSDLSADWSSDLSAVSSPWRELELARLCAYPEVFLPRHLNTWFL